MPFDKEKAKRNLKEILEKFNADTDISLMHEYHKLYKKEVSFFKALVGGGVAFHVL